MTPAHASPSDPAASAAASTVSSLRLPAAPGFATRPPFFEELVADSAGFTGTTAPAAEIVGLLLTSYAHIPRRDTGEPMSFHRRAQLASLVELVHSDNWRSGAAHRGLRTADLERIWNVDGRQVRSIIQDLEWSGMLIRLYDARNQRHVLMGIDLRPLGRRLNDLADAHGEAKRRLREDRERRREVREAEGLNEGKTTAPPEVYRRPIYNVQNPGVAKATVQEPSGDVAGLFSQVLSPPSATDARTLIAAMTAHCSVLLDLLQRDDRHSPTPLALARGVQTLLSTSFPDLRPQLWESAVRRHGFAALAAVAVVAEKQADQQGGAIRNRTAYLARMLSSPTLAHTVLTQLRGLGKRTRH